MCSWICAVKMDFRVCVEIYSSSVVFNMVSAEP